MSGPKDFEIVPFFFLFFHLQALHGCSINIYEREDEKFVLFASNLSSGHSPVSSLFTKEEQKKVGS